MNDRYKLTYIARMLQDESAAKHISQDAIERTILLLQEFKAKMWGK